MLGVSVLAAVLAPGTLERGLADLVIGVPLCLGVILFVSKVASSGTLPRHHVRVLVFSLVLLAFYLVPTMAAPEPEAVRTTTQLLLVVGFFLGVSLLKWDKQELIIFAVILGVFLNALLTYWIAEGLPYKKSVLSLHPNGLGQVVLFSLFFPWVLWSASSRRRVRLMAGYMCLCGLILMLFIGSRATWFALAVIIITLRLWDYICRGKLVYHTYFFVTIVAVLGFPAIYLSFLNSDWAGELNEFVRRATGGQNFFSGRHTLWIELLDVSEPKFWTGYGPGARPTNLLGVELSFHNLYLQVTLQVGVIGLAMLVVFLWSLWGLFWHRRRDVCVRLSAAYLIGTLVHQIFEVTITQNNVSIALLFWLIMSISASRSWRVLNEDRATGGAKVSSPCAVGERAGQQRARGTPY
jgi:O-antigen ligase